jgi:hypothetical protein
MEDTMVEAYERAKELLKTVAKRGEKINVRV